MITYLVESIVFQLLFLLAYDLFLRKETFFQWNRCYLLGSFLAAFFLPGIEFVFVNELLPANTLGAVSPRIFLDEVVLSPAMEQGTSIMPLILRTVLFIGSAISIVFFVVKLRKLKRIRENGILETHGDYQLVIIDRSKAAFSFLSTVYLGSELSPAERRSILDHELVHIRDHHSWDHLAFEIIKLLLWFNPMLYMYRYRLREVHEYIADNGAQTGSRELDYQLLLQQIFQTDQISFINHFFQSSLIKKRIVMLNKSKSIPSARFKFLTLIPLVAGMLLYSSCNNESQEKEGLQSSETKAPEQVVPLTAKESSSTVPFSVVEQVPIFPGCEDSEDPRQCFSQKMMQHIMKNFRYPETAMKQGIEGRVNLMFTILEDGTIGEIKHRGPDKSLTDEAVRIINQLPLMEPGRNNGEVVKVPFSIPITFKL